MEPETESNQKPEARTFGLIWDQSSKTLSETLKNGVGLKPVKNWNLRVENTETEPLKLDFEEQNIAENKPAKKRPHILVKGDNLEALTVLEQLYREKIDVVLIDPPYNTGNSKDTGFTYKDTFRRKEDVERHSSWLTFMKPRLLKAREVLKPNGVILIHIDDNEVHHLRVLCDEIFGEQNFIAQMVWDGGNIKNNAKLIAGSHEYLLVYARSLSVLRANKTTWREPRPGVDLLMNEYKKLRKAYGTNHAKISEGLKQWGRTAEVEKRLKVFTQVDERGPYTYADLSAPGKNGATYTVLHPETKKPCQVPSRGWGVKPETMQKLIDENRIIFGKDETQQPMRKLYLKDKTDQVKRSIMRYPARSSTHLLQHMLGRRSSFVFPKNLEMTKDLIKLVGDSNAVVLDFFAGSGTTGHGVLELNREDGGNRQFILVTNNENNICDEVTYPRLKAAMTGNWAKNSKADILEGELFCYETVKGTNPDGTYTLEGLYGIVEIAEPAEKPSKMEGFEEALYTCGEEQNLVVWTGKGEQSAFLEGLEKVVKDAKDREVPVLLILPSKAEQNLPKTDVLTGVTCIQLPSYTV